MSSDSTNDDEPIIETTAEPLHQYLQKAAQQSSPTPKATVEAEEPLKNVPVLVPRNRQPVAMLIVLDDGSREQGERIRIRTPSFAIGRERGDLKIPIDSDMSSSHAELICKKAKGQFRWYLKDCKSTNGTFVRAYRASLTKNMELLLGNRRYQFRMPEEDPALAETDALHTQAYQAPSQSLLKMSSPRLVEVGTHENAEVSFSLTKSEMRLGSDSKCEHRIEDDLYVNPVHARLYQDKRGRWMIEDQKSVNGIWLRIGTIPLDRPAEFMLGQQRFSFKPNTNESSRSRREASR